MGNEKPAPLEVQSTTKAMPRLQTGLEFDSGIRESGCSRKLTNFIANHPYMMVSISFGLCLVLSGIYFSGALAMGDGASDSPGQLMAVKELDVLRFFASQEAGRRADRADVVPVLSEVGFFLLMVYTDLSGEDDIFTKQGMQDLWEIEKEVVGVENYGTNLCLHKYDGENDQGCADPLSVLPYVVFDYYEEIEQVNPEDPPCMSVLPQMSFFDITDDLVDELTDDLVKQRIETVRICNPGLMPFFGDKTYLNDQDFQKRQQSKYTRTLFQFGTPVNETEDGAQVFINKEDDPSEQWNHHKDDIIAYFDVFDDVRAKGLSVKFNYQESVLTVLEIIDLVSGDFVLAGIAGMCVFILICIQTGSFMLSCFGMINILVSYPVALFIYHGILQIRLNTQLNLLGVYIILGIGADDVFVFTDAWKQSWLQGDHIRNNLENRMNWTWRRAANAMFITSFTTFTAFIMTGISPIPAISAFGILAALMVLVNYVMIITFFPAIVVLWAKKFERLNIRCKPNEKFNEEAEEAEEGGGRQLEKSQSRLNADVDISKYRPMERFFYNKMAPIIYKLRMIFIVLAVIFLILGWIGTAYLAPPIENESGLPESSELHQFIQVFLKAFDNSEQVSLAVMLSFYYGIEPNDPLNRDGIDPNDEENYGLVNYDKDFKFGIEQQDYLSELCDIVDESIASDGRNMALKDQTVCFIKYYLEWERNMTYARTDDEDELAKRLDIWTSSFTLPQHEELGFKYDIFIDSIGGILDEPPQLKWVKVQFACNDLTSQANADDVEYWYDEWDDLIKIINDDPDTVDGLTKGMQTSWIWAFHRTNKMLVRATYQSVGVSYIIACIILYITSGNFIVASLSSLAVMGIVVSTVGVFVASGTTLGWEESISYTMLIGISFDYVVHLANAFNEQQFHGRYHRARGALFELGISVFGAGMTTAISAFFLLFTQLKFFQVFGKFIFATILISMFWAVVLFIAILMGVGPNDHKTGNFVHCIKTCQNPEADIDKQASPKAGSEIDMSESGSNQHNV